MPRPRPLKKTKRQRRPKAPRRRHLTVSYPLVRYWGTRVIASGAVSARNLWYGHGSALWLKTTQQRAKGRVNKVLVDSRGRTVEGNMTDAVRSTRFHRIEVPHAGFVGELLPRHLWVPRGL